MRFTMGGFRRVAAILAALAAPAVFAAPASAVNIGSPSLAYGPAGNTGSAKAVLQANFSAAIDQVSSDGYITDFGASFNCVDGTCGDVKLVVLRPTQSAGTWDVVTESPAVTPDGSLSSERFTLASKIRVQPGDKLGLELGQDTRVNYVGWPSTNVEMVTSATGFTTSTKSFESTANNQLAMYNATLEPLPPVNTTVTTTTNPVIASGTSTYDVTVAAPTAPSPSPAITGTVSLFVDSTPVAGCQNLPVVDDKASCDSVAPAQRTYRTVKATYSGDANYSAGTRTPLYQWVIERAQLTASATPNPVERSASITYGAEIANVMLASIGPADAPSYGTAAFFVDGQPVTGCGAQPVDQTGLPKCVTQAPPVVGSHTLEVVYSGDELRAPNAAETTFDVIGPGAKVSDAVAFGATPVDTTVTRTITLTSTGKVALSRVGAGITGAAFSIVSDGCATVKLPTGAACDVVVAYRPAAAGAHTGAVMFGESVATVALSGTGVAPAAPVAPVAPNPGATLDPKKKPTFTVTIPAGNGARASQAPTLALPLSCPAETECELDGRLTIDQSALASRKAKSAAATTTTVAKFSKLQVKAGGLKTVKLRLSPAFVKSAQKQGIRRIRATLTINTVLGSGEKITTRQRITILLPKAAKKKAAKQHVRPRFTG